jgi:leader peptidase (prepilin peptidase)/N-methyltransferase
MVVYAWLILVFVLGAIVGSFLNVCIARLPMEKSILWPASRCGSCFQPVRWYDNLPLISYWWLRGRCRSCGARFSSQYFFVELLTGLGLVGLFYLEVVLMIQVDRNKFENLHGWPIDNPWAVSVGSFPAQSWIAWGYHAILFSFLMAASITDLNGREIPLPLTLTGTVVGLIGSVCFPWPWPLTPSAATPTQGSPPGWEWLDPGQGLKAGLYPWPVWGPLPSWLEPGGNWQTGLATGLAGMLVGTFFLRAVGFLFSTGLGKEALGLGDADLMMMAGAFLGWQPVVVAFFVSVFPALVFGVIQLMVRGDNSLPFGPSLAMGIVLTFLGWRWLGPVVQPLLFFDVLLACLAVVAGAFMLGSSYLLRLGGRGPR